MLPLVLMFAVFYFLLIRPQRKKDKKVKDMLKNLKVSDRICTIGGIYGTITAIKDDTIELSVGKDNVKLIFARWAIRNVEEIAIENDSEALN
ncbi:MAG: preprotein translocase subunit YajC [Clostridia bacterium]